MNEAPTSALFHGASPITNTYASGQAADYGEENLDDDYGYRALNEDKDFRMSLHLAAKSAKVPGQWLADVAALQTNGTFDPRLGLVGLPGRHKSETGMLTRAEQMQALGEALGVHAGSFDTIERLWAYVHNQTDKAFGKPSEYLLLDDGEKTNIEHLRNLGQHAGRRYYNTFDGVMPRSVHSAYHEGCSICADMKQKLGSVLPHEKPL
jgi:hypothetical protein